MQEHPRTNQIPLLIHLVNVSALLLGGVLLLLTGVTRTYQLLLLGPVVGLLVVYWRLRHHPSVVAGYFGMALALLAWIVFCEHIVTFDKVFGTRISEHLRLGVRLRTYVLRTLPTEEQKDLEACCGDPLTWHYRPGSRYRTTFDCPTCTPAYEVTADETGYLNPPGGFLPGQAPIDLFVAGDSVLQGMGVPSVVDRLRRQIPLHMWNLSIPAYGPRQKINALLTYALPKSPRWLIVEFFAGNDLPDAIRNDVCQQEGDFRCRSNAPTVERLLAHHPTYATIFEVRTDVWARVADYATENLTLATTRYLFSAIKGAIKPPLVALANAVSNREAADRSSETEFPLGAGPPVRVRAGQWLAYVQAGMAVTQQQYERLWTTLAGRDHPPAVILLYNPATYEVYRGTRLPPHPQADQMSAVQRDTLRAFAQRHGWSFLDLTEPLREAVRGGEIWLYGRYDRSHWSPQGTAVVADVLAAELLTTMRLHQR